MWSKWNNLPTMLVAIIIIIQLLWKTLAVTKKAKRIPTLWSRNFTPRYTPVRTESWFTKDLQNILRSFIYNSKKWGTTQMPINKLEKQFIVYSYDRTPHNKRELIHTTWRNLTNTMLKKPTKKRAYDSIYIEFRNKHKFMVINIIIVVTSGQRSWMQRGKRVTEMLPILIHAMVLSICK